MVEDAGGDQGPQGLAAAIRQVGNLVREITGQQVERPAESIQPARDPFQPFLVLPAKLLGDDPVAAGGPDIVEVGLDVQLAGDARRRASEEAAPCIPRRSGRAARASP